MQTESNFYKLLRSFEYTIQLGLTNFGKPAVKLAAWLSIKLQFWMVVLIVAALWVSGWFETLEQVLSFILK